MTAVLDQAALQITREREASQPRNPLLLLPASCSAMPSPAWRWLWALPPWPGGLVQRDPCCRSGRGPGAIGNGAWSSAGPRAGEEPEP